MEMPDVARLAAYDAHLTGKNLRVFGNRGHRPFHIFAITVINALYAETGLTTDCKQLICHATSIVVTVLKLPSPTSFLPFLAARPN